MRLEDLSLVTTVSNPGTPGDLVVVNRVSYPGCWIPARRSSRVSTLTEES